MEHLIGLHFAHARGDRVRIAHVERALGVFRQQCEDIAREVSRQMGKPISEARREVDTFLDRARHLISIAPEALAPEELPPKPGFVRRIEHWTIDNHYVAVGMLQTEAAGVTSRRDQLVSVDLASGAVQSLDLAGAVGK